MPNLEADAKKLKKILEAVHPKYTQFSGMWKIYEDCYAGGQAIVGRIHKHLRESTASVTQRRARAFYPNYCQTIIDAYMSYIFRKGVIRQAVQKEDKASPEQRVQEALMAQDAAAQQQGGQGQMPQPPFQSSQEEVPTYPWDPAEESARTVTGSSKKKSKKKNPIEEDLEAFWKDVDLCGTPVDTFMAEVGAKMLTFGQYHAIVDMPKSKKEAKSELERKQTGLRPYLSQVSPFCLSNWEYGRDGKLLWIRIKEEVTSEIDPFEDRPEHAVCEYRTWTRDSWYVHQVQKDKAELVDRGNHDLEEVPLVTFNQASMMPLSPISASFIKDIGPLNLAILNWGSLIDNEAYERCLNILVMERSQQTGAEIVIGTNNALEYDKGGVPPHFLAASTAPAAFIQTMIRETVQEIYRLSRLGGLTGRMVREARSGVAYKFESHEANQALAAKADRLEAGEKRVHELHEKWLGREWRGVIDYPEEFGIESVEEEVQLLTQVKQQLRSPTLKRLLEKKSAAKLLGKVPKSTLAVVDAEIDALEEVKPTFGFGGGF